MQAFIVEVQRRKVFKTFLPYIGFVWLLLQVVSVVAPMLNLSPLVNTFIAVVLFVGIPVMLYLSWYFNFTTSGLEAIPDAKSGEVSRFGLIRWTIFLSIMLLSAYLGFSYFNKVQVHYAKTNQGTLQKITASSIAVIPFIDNSPEQDQDYLAKGVAEEIVALLGSSARLKVVASSSVNTLLAKGLDPISIARRLEVETVLTGTVRRTGNNLRLRVELINVKDGKVLWAESYTRKVDDIFALESTIARSVLNTLIEEFITVDEFNNPSVTKNAEAYLMYLNGRAAYRKQTVEGLKEARKYYEQSIAIAPEFSQAYVALADTIVLSADREQKFEILQPQIAKTLAENYLAKALIRTQDLPSAFAVQGKVFELDGQLDNALAAFNKAITINPSLATAHKWKYEVLRSLGRVQEAFEALKTALELDPESISLRNNFGIELNKRRQLIEAEAVFIALIKDHPSSALGHAGLATTYNSAGAISKSYQSWSKAYSISPNNDEYFYRVVSILINLSLNDDALKLVDSPSLQAYILLNNNENKELNELMALKRQAYAEDAWALFDLTWFEIQTGNYDYAAESLAFVDETLSDVEKYVKPQCSPAIEIAWSYLISDKDAKGQSIIDACAKELKQQQSSAIKSRAANYLKLRIAALTNDQTDAIAMLETLLEQGFRQSWIFNDPLLDNMKDLPEIQLLFNTLRDLIEIERSDLQRYLELSPTDSGGMVRKPCDGEQYQCSLEFHENIRAYLMLN